MTFDQRSSDPDWDRYLVAKAAGAPVGDPTRWGAMQRTTFETASWSGFGTVTYLLVTPQIIAAATRDSYPRSWSILGELTLPISAWDAPSVYPTPIAGGMNVTLDITLGGGMAQLTQQIVLMVGNTPQGLCNQQCIRNGGPYGETIRPGGPGATEYQRSRPFAAIGSLVANTIAIRVRYELGDPPPFLLTLANPAILTLIVTPHAAGEGL